MLTADDLWLMPNQEVRRELIRGELITKPLFGAEHGAITNNFAIVLAKHVRENRLGEVFASGTGFVLSRQPDTVVGVDVAFVRAARIPAGGVPSGFWEGAPDLAVETLSPSDTVEEVEEKVDAYLNAGARTVLVLNPKRKTITVHKTSANPTILHVGETLDLDEVVPGFKCAVADVFV